MTAAAPPPAPGAAEEVATWRPIEEVDVDGWRAGFSGGFTRRANSVLPAGRPTDVDAAVERVEAAYRSRGLPPRFRVCAASRPEVLDERLAARGYRAVATTQVLVRALEAADARSAGDPATPPTPARELPFTTILVADEPDDAWLSGWLDVKAAGGGVDRGLARAVVSGSRSAYLTAVDPAGVVGVVRAARADGWVGLSCLMVAPRARRRGVGRALTVAALDDAAAGGVRWAFLQVEDANAAARALYEGMGFRHAETYRYREL